VIDAPPLFAGAVQDTTDWVVAAPVADTPVGAFGTPTGVIAKDAEDADPVPETFVATTVKV
jgi:hypothetical protein